ncbi:hypothetical protein NV379_25660 [Paenibacillus sp. N1-5-1-14]|uniref:hypothetical protein n=1 Tax=Paenibacillus radicibacter TaxID=2972488 RepID=UPI0021595A92|nr:hypothetical protein [Paenibacillus radicibacter]MCR8646013.1 hypothetical protein [Paenibacillus radicibacter]
MTERSWEKTFTAAAQSIFAILQYTDKKDSYTLVDIMGLTGHAFRINIHPNDVSPAGPTMFSPTELLEKGLNILGFTCEQLYGFPTPAPPEKLEEAVRFAQETIDRGVPAIGWSLFIPEFGVIYGYDDEKQELYCKDPSQEGPLPYSKLNELPLNFVFMLRARESVLVDQLQAWKIALERIVKFAREEAPTLSKDYRHGLAGYDAWIQAFRNRTVNPFGNAYNAEVVGDAREFAVQFLQSLPSKWSAKTNMEKEICELAMEAAMHYEKVAEVFRVFQCLFPHPHGGDPNDLKNAEHAITLLECAKENETLGVAILEQMYNQILRAEAILG